MWTKAKKPIIALAPMVDVTNSAFRQICAQFGADVVFSEMVVADAVIHALAKIRPMLEFAEVERPYVVQLASSSTDKVIEVAKIVLAEFQPDGLDINMGCPALTAKRGKYGAMLLEQPDIASEMVHELKKIADVPVTAKIRRVQTGDDEQTITFAKQLQTAGLDGLTVHGRTRHEHYETPADWGLAAKIKAELKIPVFGSGDLLTAEDVRRFLAETKADGVLIARGAIGNPWIFRQTKHLLASGELLETPDWLERAGILAQHAKLVEKLYGPRAVLPFRKHASKYTADLAGIKPLREQLVRAETFAELHNLLLTS